MTSDVLVAYVFESVDLAPVPGFSGTPPNLLVALKPDGSFLAVRVLSQHEPVFVGGLGPEPLDRFVDQYARLSLKRSWRVDSAAKARNSGGGPDAIDGVAKATASVRIINESITAAALKVARAKLGYATGADPALQIRPRLGAFTAKNWVELGASGLVSHFLVLNAEVETAFRGSIVEGLDQDGLANPDTPFIDIYFGALELPVVGRNLLGDKVFDKLTEKLAGAHAIFVLSVGRWNPFDEPFVRGSVPERIFLDQDRLSFEIRDLDLEDEPVLAGIPAGTFKSLKIFEQAGFDPSRSWSLGARVTRSKGQVFPERIIKNVPSFLFTASRPFRSKGTRAVECSDCDSRFARNGSGDHRRGARRARARAVAAAPADVGRPQTHRVPHGISDDHALFHRLLCAGAIVDRIRDWNCQGDCFQSRFHLPAL